MRAIIVMAGATASVVIVTVAAWAVRHTTSSSFGETGGASTAAVDAATHVGAVDEDAGTRPRVTTSAVPTAIGADADADAEAPGSELADLTTQDLADPAVLRVGDTYYVYATGAAGSRVQVLSSTDLTHWYQRGDALATPPQWAATDWQYTWAPTVTPSEGGYTLFVSVLQTSTHQMCITSARSRTPWGPFVATSASPLLCQHGDGGSIDPSIFHDPDGTTSLVWKSDGLRNVRPSAIWTQRFNGDLTALVGAPVQLLRSDQPWEDGVVEGPAIVAHNGQYIVLYAANDWRTASYATASASCASLTGPCRKASAPWLTTDPARRGPGGASTFDLGAGAIGIAYHAWVTDAAGAEHRTLRLAQLVFDSTGAPSTQPIPVSATHAAEATGP